ncbi:MAG: hypothetical protein ACLFWF_09895 [Alphaproteobacteria bacterium]
MKKILVLLCAATVAACMGVRQEDLDSWRGVPVSVLDKHPIFITMHMTKTVAPDGTEIRNYRNKASSSQCFGHGSATVDDSGFIPYTLFNQCVSREGACNNIFYIKDGKVTSYVPVGSGGVKCYTDERVRPYYRGSTNYQ